MTYKFYVVVPTYGRPDLLKRAIESVLRQNYSNWHLIVGSEDTSTSTWNVIMKFKQKLGGKMSIIKLPPHLRGPNRIRNLGIILALKMSDDPKNDFIMFLDDDDYLYSSDVLSKFLSIIKAYPEYYIYSFDSIDINGRLYASRPSGDINIYSYFRTKGPSDVAAVQRLNIYLEMGEKALLPWNLLGYEGITACQIYLWCFKNNKKCAIHITGIIGKVMDTRTESLTRRTYLDKMGIIQHARGLRKFFMLCGKACREYSPATYGEYLLKYSRILALLGYKNYALRNFFRGIFYIYRGVVHSRENFYNTREFILKIMQLLLICLLSFLDNKLQLNNALLRFRNNIIKKFEIVDIR